MNLSLVLQMAADAEPERIGLVCDGRRWSYGALWGAARGAAAAIRESGCTHVALLDENSEAAAIALFGAAMAGIPYVPLNYRLADADLAALLKRITPACIIGDVDRIERLSPDGGNVAWTRRAFVSAAEQIGRHRHFPGRIRRRDRHPAVHQRHDRRAEGRRTAPRESAGLHPGHGGVWLGIAGGSGARLRAALPHCRNRGAAQFDLCAAAHRTAAGLRSGRLARARREGARYQRLPRADHARPASSPAWMPVSRPIFRP